MDISSEYNDNIYGRKMKEEDVINRISPGITLKMPAYHKELMLNYQAGFEFYVKNSHENTVTHNLSGEANYQPTERLTLKLTEAYVRSRNLYQVDIYGIRRERIPYWQNRLNPQLNYQFGERDNLLLGYQYNIFRYTETGYETENSDEHTFNMSLNHGLTKTGLLNLNYIYTYGKFPYYWGKLKGHTINIGYNWLLSPHTTIMTIGTYERRHYSLVFDYETYQILFGIERQFSQRLSATLQGGYFIYHPEIGENIKGFSGNATVSYNYEYSQLTFRAEKGYTEMLFTVLNLGFNTYWQLSLDLTHTFTPHWSGQVGGSYRRSKYPYLSAKDRYWTGYIGIDWSPIKWCRGRLEYRHEDLNSTGFYESYNINRIMLSFHFVYFRR